MPELSEACMHHTGRLVCGFKHRGKNQKDPTVIALCFVIVNVFCTLWFLEFKLGRINTVRPRIPLDFTQCRRLLVFASPWCDAFGVIDSGHTMLAL